MYRYVGRALAARPSSSKALLLLLLLLLPLLLPSRLQEWKLTEKSNRASCASKDAERTLVMRLYTVLDRTDEETSTGTGSACGHTIGERGSFRKGLCDDLLIGLLCCHFGWSVMPRRRVMRLAW